MSIITYQCEAYTTVLPELKLLYPEHWEEIACNKDSVPLNPDYGRYQALDEAGILFLTTIRDAGSLIGYFLGFIMPHLHYQQSTTLFYDIFFLRKSHRHGRTGIKLFQFVEAAAKAKGVEKIYLSTKVKADISPLFEYLNYTLCEKVYTKML